MYLDEQYTMYKLAHDLVNKDHFDVLYIHDEKEIWLEKYQRKTSKVVRLQQGGFNWKNHLKQDIGNVFQKVKSMKRLLMGKEIEIHNVYISSHEPVDEWEILKKPLQLKEKNPLKMKVYYVSDGVEKEELMRLRDEVGFTADPIADHVPETEMENKLPLLKKDLAYAWEHKQKEAQKVFSRGKPRFTYVLLIVNILLFMLLEYKGGSSDIDTLIQYGAKYNPAIMDGEYWRIVSSMFLHIGFLHLFMNMLAVCYLGIAVERIYGSWRFLIIYFLAGIGGGVASFVFTTNVSAGASGALFGLFGALLFFGVVYKRLFFQTMGRGLLTILVINIVFGFMVPQIDMGAHMGGLAGGFLAAALVHLPGRKRVLSQFAASMAYIVLVAGMFLFGIQNNLESPSFHLMNTEFLVQKEEYEAVIDSANKGLEDPGDFEAPLVFQRAFANVQLNKAELAIADFEKTAELAEVDRDKDLQGRSYSNLAIIYDNRGQNETAIGMIKQAYELRPADEETRKLYEQITGKKPD